MKEKFYLSLAALLFITTNAQVGIGINTANPRTDLDVNGSFKSDNIIAGKVDQVGSEEKDRYLLLTQNASDNSIKRIDPRLSGAPGIATIATYKLTNVGGDWLERFNTRINSNDYALVIMSAYFDRNVSLGGSGLVALPSFGVRSIGGFWNLYADYSGMAPLTDGTWTFVCAIYPKTYVKLFGERTKNLNNTSSGTDTSPILNP
ncbi:hypothetical protein PQ459_08500 [Chryseobacterium sp. KACC 21268]|nr:hypothetical protein PQ459_08500 [Chryseobacterium sp. KACC 21268]